MNTTNATVFSVISYALGLALLLCTAGWSVYANGFPTEVNALALTKLDGTAKGGVVIGISDQFKIPVKYIGVGEGMEHLQVFNRKEFVDSLFSK